LEASGDPRAAEIGQVLAAIADLRDQVRSLSGESAPDLYVGTQPPQEPFSPVTREGRLQRSIYLFLLNSKKPMSTDEVIEGLPRANPDAIERELHGMARKKLIVQETDSSGRSLGWSNYPSY
jgi:hypothetical protein